MKDDHGEHKPAVDGPDVSLRTSSVGRGEYAGGQVLHETRPIGQYGTPCGAERWILWLMTGLLLRS